MSGHEESTPQIQVLPADRKKILKLWKIAGIMAIVTAIEFGFAFGMERGALLIGIFVLLTIVKAYYIVSEFMHLGHEKNSLVNSIILPLIFLVWLILAALIEAQWVFDSIDGLWVNILG